MYGPSGAVTKGSCLQTQTASGSKEARRVPLRDATYGIHIEGGEHPAKGTVRRLLHQDSEIGLF